jgi:large subunit ribosomal protein L15
MKNLGNLSPAKGSNKSRKRLGRGIGSGLGKTAGKGHKGQKARKGAKITPGFEGGQTPLYRRLPKFGFSRDHKKTMFHLVSLSALNKFNDGETVELNTLFEKGIIRDTDLEVKILSNGILERKQLSVKVAKISKNAQVSIEKNGGKIEGIN